MQDRSDGLTYNAELPEIGALMRRFEAPGGVFRVEGDNDSANRLEILPGIDIEWLDNEVAVTSIRAEVSIGVIEVVAEDR